MTREDFIQSPARLDRCIVLEAKSRAALVRLYKSGPGDGIRHHGAQPETWSKQELAQRIAAHEMGAEW